MKKIYIVGLGAGNLEQMPLGIYRFLKGKDEIYVRTDDHPAITSLKEEGLRVHSFDSIYIKHEQFTQVYEEIVTSLLELVKQKNELIYAVPGHPFVAERTIQLLEQQAVAHNVELEYLGGQSFLDPMYNALRIDPIEGLQIVDGTDLKQDAWILTHHTIIVQVYDAFIASEVKLTLMERLPDDYPVTIATAVGSKEEVLETVPLYELDRVTNLNNLTAVYVPPVKSDILLHAEFDQLRKVIAQLRGPNGCPWDQKQTHQSLKKYLIEEAYEVLEAIDEEDDVHLIEELGDILLQVMLHAQIGEDEGIFTIRDVIESITDKMIRRHPHVFADIKVENEEEVVKNWEKIKSSEKAEEKQSDSIFAKKPKGLPALQRTIEIQNKAAKVGFDWGEPAPVWMKLQEEIGEFLTEAKKSNQQKMNKEFGDLLFVAINLARHYDIDPEKVLHMANEKFMNRFQEIELAAKHSGKELTEMTLTEMDQLWEESKTKYE
ncbi:nucleoside triphosphate pyrophosphohydrolase [Alkalihalobacillus trypoxylicola]|uniref:MazG family protein n=1 Tax=Alkalihalobacillus trypoxylicola TaxID=519424 RepID=A0A161PJ10_9BACI|nr:nucleoside triphosphate pyrophosphohydrolase [Alkalihalobacillus trypoxylicola]KYG33305.1 MazG family protein [Alkalihalobacillus trypoxylicola]